MSMSLWFASSEALEVPNFSGNARADVVVVGAGITGLVAADLLTTAGRSVIVVDMMGPGRGETGHTTAHLTVAFDRGYATIGSKIGEDAARLIARASESAVDWLEARSKALGAGRFSRVDGWLYCETEDDAEWIEKEHRASVEAGLRCTLEDAAPVPYPTARGVRYFRQGQFHPIEFSHALVADLQRRGCRLYGGSKVEAVDDGEPCRVHLDGGMVIETGDVIVATNVPVIDRVLMQTRLYAYRTYAIAVDAREDDPEALLFDTMDPYHYIRTQQTAQGTFLIIGGEDHRTGTEEDTTARFEALERYATERFGRRETRYRWSGQVIDTPDGLPYAGLNPGAEHVYIAAGYAGQGFTMGTAAAGTIVESIEGRESALSELLSPKRVEIRGGIKRYVTENLEFPTHFLADRLTHGNVTSDSLDEIPPGEGRIVEIDGKKAAAFRGPDGELRLLSTICPHLGCDVRWNDAESSWDCPCHGSRFDPSGKVLNSPARRDLERL